MNILSGNEIEGTFLREDKRRFLCYVLIGKNEYKCYLPSSCKICKIFNLAGRSVLLYENGSASNRTKYSVFAVKVGTRFILLNLAEANSIIAQNLMKRSFSFLGKRRSVKREEIIDGYKSDLYIEDTDTVIEIKTLLSFDEEAIFPSVKTKRTEIQLSRIVNLLDSHKVVLLIVVLNPDIKRIRLNPQMREIYRLVL